MPKISELPSVINPSGIDVIPVVSQNNTKKITLNEAVTAGLPNIINANVSIKTDTKNNLDSYIPPLGVITYATDEKTLRIGDGNSFGGQYIKNISYFKHIKDVGLTKLPLNGMSLDPVLNVSLPTTPATGIYNVKLTALFVSGPISGNSGIISPHIDISIPAEAGFLGGSHELTQLELYQGVDSQTYFQATDTQVTRNITPITLFEYYDISIDNPIQNSSNILFSYKSDYYLSVSSSGTVGCSWGCNGNNSMTIRDAFMHIERIK